MKSSLLKTPQTRQTVRTMRDLLALTLILVTSSHIFKGTNSGQVHRLGNVVRPAISGIDVAGATFILKDVARTTGVVFAYSAFFRSEHPVRFQIWRPVSTGNDTADFYKLMADLPMQPSVVLQREDVYIESRLVQPCVAVEAGDRFGVVLEGLEGSIAYTFDNRRIQRVPYRISNVTAFPHIGDTVSFDSLLFPYEFSAAAFIYSDPQLDLQRNPPACPKGIMVPSYQREVLSVTEPPPVTGAPGLTGATGPQGPIGAIGAIGPPGIVGPKGEVGATGPRGAEGLVGPIGAKGSHGEQGIPGQTGATGPSGPKGEKGDVGPPGKSGQDGSIRVINTGAASRDDGTIFSKPFFVMILMIWLILVTLLLLVCFILLLCLYCHWKRKVRTAVADTNKTRTYNGFDSKFGRPDTRTDPVDPDWVNTLKEDTFEDYHNDTISDIGKMTPQTSVTLPRQQPSEIRVKVNSNGTLPWNNRSVSYS